MRVTSFAGCGLRGTRFSICVFFLSSRRRHTRFDCDWSSDVCSSDLAIVILGGLGSIGGVVIGALVVNGAPELLRSSSNARFLFYGVLLLALFVALRPWYKPVIVLLGTIAFGYAVHGIASAVWSRGTAGHIDGAGRLGRALEQ